MNKFRKLRPEKLPYDPMPKEDAKLPPMAGGSSDVATEWPHTKSVFGVNDWWLELDRFMAALHDAKDLSWWVSDMGLKYLNVRIDTRNNSFKLYLAGHKGDDSCEEISPIRVMQAIAKAKGREDTP